MQGWIGGWLLPQEASYFALALPHGWWLFGLDLALVDDIDMCQTRWDLVKRFQLRSLDKATCSTWTLRLLYDFDMYQTQCVRV